MGKDRTDQRETPTAAEIRAGCAEVQATWSPADWARRGKGSVDLPDLEPVRLFTTTGQQAEAGD